MKSKDALDKMINIVLAYKYRRKPKQGKRKLAKRVKKRD